MAIGDLFFNGLNNIKEKPARILIVLGPTILFLVLGFTFHNSASDDASQGENIVAEGGSGKRGSDAILMPEVETKDSSDMRRSDLLKRISEDENKTPEEFDNSKLLYKVMPNGDTVREDDSRYYQVGVGIDDGPRVDRNSGNDGGYVYDPNVENRYSDNSNSEKHNSASNNDNASSNDNNDQSNESSSNNTDARRRRNVGGSYGSLTDDQKSRTSKMIKAVVHNSNRWVRSGDEITIRLTQDAEIDGTTIGRNTMVTGTVAFSQNRANVTVTTFRYKGRIVNGNFAVYDNDGRSGIKVRSNMLNEAGKDVVGEGVNGASTSIDLGRFGSVSSDILKRHNESPAIIIKDGHQISLKPL